MKQFDDIIQQKANQHHAAVPAGVWENIIKKKRKKQLIFFWIVFLILLSAGIAGGLLINNENDKKPNIISVLILVKDIQLIIF